MESLPQSVKISLLSPIESFCGQSVPSLSVLLYCIHSKQVFLEYSTTMETRRSQIISQRLKATLQLCRAVVVYWLPNRLILNVIKHRCNAFIWFIYIVKFLINSKLIWGICWQRQFLDSVLHIMQITLTHTQRCILNHFLI